MDLEGKLGSIVWHMLDNAIQDEVSSLFEKAPVYLSEIDVYESLDDIEVNDRDLRIYTPDAIYKRMRRGKFFAKSKYPALCAILPELPSEYWDEIFEMIQEAVEYSAPEGWCDYLQYIDRWISNE